MPSYLSSTPHSRSHTHFCEPLLTLLIGLVNLFAANSRATTLFVGSTGYQSQPAAALCLGRWRRAFLPSLASGKVWSLGEDFGYLSRVEMGFDEEIVGVFAALGGAATHFVLPDVKVASHQNVDDFETERRVKSGQWPLFSPLLRSLHSPRH